MEASAENALANEGNAATAMSRKEKRKLLKKEKRKQSRKETAIREKEEEESRLNDAEELAKRTQLEIEELARMERDRLEFEERERVFLRELELKKKREQEDYEQEQEQHRLKQVEDEKLKEMDEGSDWEFVEDGPAEIIWKGNEIIVKKNRVRVPKKNVEQQNKKEDAARPTSNPLAPQSEAFEHHKSAQDILDTVAQQVPNFGTEQDKAHCPFHLKTGACRFGARCSRVHFYPDKSCTLLMKNMYGGPGLVWEQDEGLEHTDEEVERSFEEFYEDVHTEFLKFGEIVNFKVCRNGSPHLRGNVYVHYKSVESAVLAYRSSNGRYFAGKQVICEFINLTKWKTAICGEFMKSRLERCSRGSACNFIHCFRNPGGDYEWADWDRPPPRYWIKRMAALFGYEDVYDKKLDESSPDKTRSASKRIRLDTNRRHSRSISREPDSRHTRSYNDNDVHQSKGQQWRRIHEEREKSPNRDRNEEKVYGKGNHNMRGKSPNIYSDDDESDRELGRINHEQSSAHKRRHRRSRRHSKERSSASDSDRDASVKDNRGRYFKEYRSHRRSARHHDSRSPESDSERDTSIIDRRERDHKNRNRSSQNQRDSCKTEDECSRKEENHQIDPDGRNHEDTMVKKREGYHAKRRKSSRWSNNEMDCSDRDVGDSFDGYGDEYYRHKKGSSNPETESKKADLSECSHGSHMDKHENRESSRHRKKEKSHKSDRRSSRHHRKDNAASNAILPDKEEGSERAHNGRKGSSWNQSSVEEHVVHAHEGQHEREVCRERLNSTKHGRLDNGVGHASQKTRSGERVGDGHSECQEISVEMEAESEQACRRAALQKLQEKQLQKELSSSCGNLKAPKTIRDGERSLTFGKVNEDQNDIEAETRKRRRI